MQCGGAVEGLRGAGLRVGVPVHGPMSSKPVVPPSF